MSKQKSPKITKKNTVGGERKIDADTNIFERKL